MLSAFTPALARDHCTTDPSAGSCLQVGANRSLLLSRQDTPVLYFHLRFSIGSVPPGHTPDEVYRYKRPVLMRLRAYGNPAFISIGELPLCSQANG